MENSPLRFLDYDISLLLNDYVNTEIKKQSKIFHNDHLNNINDIILNKLNNINFNDINILTNSFDKHEMIIANTCYYKSILNKIINIGKHKIIRISDSHIDNFFFTMINLWIDIPCCYDYNPIFPSIQRILMRLIKNNYIISQEKFKHYLLNSIQILDNTMGMDKYKYLQYHTGAVKPFSMIKYQSSFFKEWCCDFIYPIDKNNFNKHIYELIIEIINDNYYPNSNDYLLNLNYLLKNTKVFSLRKDKQYFFDKLWNYSGREIGYIYHYNSSKKFKHVDDHRYLMIDCHYKLKYKLKYKL